MAVPFFWGGSRGTGYGADGVAGDGTAGGAFAADDAADAQWVALSTLARSRVAFDHSRIIALAVERHRYPEQALDHALMDVASQVDALLELARPLALGRHRARDRGQRRGLAQRPEKVPLGIVERRLGQQPVGEDNPEVTSGCRHRRADQPNRLGEHVGELGRELPGHVTRELDHPILAQ